MPELSEADVDIARRISRPTRAACLNAHAVVGAGARLKRLITIDPDGVIPVGR
jgi:hypothetical protein